MTDLPKPPEGTDPGRGRTVFVHGWWGERVKKWLADDGKDQAWLAGELDTDPGQISKCINNKVPTLQLMKAISDRLDIPMPVVFPETYEEALVIEKERKQLRLRRRARAKDPDK